MSWLWQAVALFAVTTLDDLVVLSLFFGRARAEGHGALQIAIGQYLGFLVILAVSVAGALVEGLLPGNAIRYLGILPLVIGVRAGWSVWRRRGQPSDEHLAGPPGVKTVAGVSLANSGDNIGVYVPTFATLSKPQLAGYSVVFLAMVGVWCLIAHTLTGHARVLGWITRWGHVLYPVVLIAIGAHILVSG